jgi:hypothetical protein
MRAFFAPESSKRPAGKLPGQAETTVNIIAFTATFVNVKQAKM